MTQPNPYAVPLTDLDAVHVDVDRHVSTRPVDAASSHAALWGGGLGGSVNGGGGADVDSDGE